MTPSLEVAHVRLATISWIKVNLAVVHLVGNHSGNVLRKSTRTNILAIATATGRSIVGVDARNCDIHGYTRQAVIPGQPWHRSIGTVDVMRVENVLDVAGGNG
jgi:hypothetical protein